MIAKTMMDPWQMKGMIKLYCWYGKKKDIWSWKISVISEMFWCMYIHRIEYPTGQRYSLELKFAKLATAKIAKDLNPLKFHPTCVSCLKTTLRNTNNLHKCCSDWDSNLQFSVNKSVTLPTELHLVGSLNIEPMNIGRRQYHC